MSGRREKPRDASPIGPLACILSVLTATSAPKPNSPPSLSLVLALTNTALASTSSVNLVAAL